jgi:hypothetical protein
VTESLPFGRYLFLAHDASGYSALDGARQERAQADIRGVIGRAAELAGLHRDLWTCQSRGDGELAVLPPSESELVLLDGYVPHLTHQLRAHNADRYPGRRLRLRVAIHHGAGVGAALGVAGAAAVGVCRLLDSQQARDALAASAGDLFFIVSETVLLVSVAPGHTTIDPGLFRRVWVSNHGFEEWAYLYAPAPAAASGEDQAEEGQAEEGQLPGADTGGKVGQASGAGPGQGTGAGSGDRSRSDSGRKIVKTKVGRIEADKVIFGFEAPGHD